MDSPSLGSLIEHQEAVPADASLEQVVRRFQEHGRPYMAVLDGTTYLGLLSGAQIGTMLGSRFGFSLHIRDSARHHLLSNDLRVHTTWTLLQVLDGIMARKGSCFYHDVPLLSGAGEFLGLISVHRLIQEQARIMSDQMTLAERRRERLEESNHQLLQSLEELRQSEGRYESLFQHSPLGIALLDRKGSLEVCNRRLQAWLGPMVQEGGQDLTRHLPEADLAPFLALLPGADGQPGLPVVESEVSLPLPGQGARRFRVHASWIEETGQICAALQDITHQRILERGMAVQEKAALFERLAGGLAHELNNKLTPVVGYADLLSLRLAAFPEAAKALKQCEMIHSSASEAVRIVRQLLQLSRPPQAEKSVFRLDELVKEAWAIVEYRLRAGGVKGLLELAPDQAVVHADGPQIKQVIVNLVINAIDAMEHATDKQLRLRLETRDGSARLSVRDTGHGIPPENLRRIFDPFFTTKPPDRGTGLGLSVCLSILQQHNGDIQVASNPGEGSCFTIALPLCEAAGHQSSPRPAPAPFSPARRQILRVLAIDDEDHIAECIRESLQAHCGWLVETCREMSQAIAILDRHSFDLVLTDLRMPGLDGFALLSWAKSSRQDLLSKILVVTADPGEMNLEATWGVGMLKKPFRPAELVSACHAVLARRARPSQDEAFAAGCLAAS